MGKKDNLLFSVGLAGGGGAEPLLAGNGTNGVMGENGTMSNMSVDVFEDMLFPCKCEQCVKYISNLRNHSLENQVHIRVLLYRDYSALYWILFITMKSSWIQNRPNSQTVYVKVWLCALYK